jgi:homoserine O-acetyltransferase
MVDTLLALDQPVSYCNVESSCGHDAFLLANDLASYGGLIGGFLDNLDEAHASNRPPADQAAAAHKPTSIFHNRKRVDYELIAELIPENSSVLDLGCGTGGLLSLLRSRSQQQMLGVELDEQSVVTCVRRGLNVIQADLNKGLSSLKDAQFDVVVLSQTLQTVIDVRRVVNEMLRVGKRAIVSFPNLGYHKLRQQLYEEGRAPLVALGGGTCWYDTHNVRFLTIADFNEFCQDEGIRIHETVALDTEAGTRVEQDPNRNADMAILVISR